ncbi:response regulator transcription factor [Candidatus Methylopumilus universalis]|uniref:response regulator transcription factor n=1 Tax=Candidatus Methylopumilus universalis TaxID=2588536 RepID=UPI00111D78DE|nr:response regulator [Candidatus Methylopumilus universalis]QDC78819.1 response regulator transcription factor [Candidatus Methylopumilus universalis]QDC80101.1 response regulator transcription factor [Candidatus Methylopumilus universalis]QDC81402.1 response regulator transcription factor [Candidatus Methylopumilus universalis]QDC87841.1 response regulator transcription factor [Candidatus Methylopumilus universalis]
MSSKSDKKITIHLIEDDVSQRDSIESLLAFKGFITKSYSTANDFLQTLPFERPAIVIADIQLPDISGVDLHRMLMEKNINPPIIFISGEASIQESIDAMKQGAIEFLVKPFEIDILIAAVNNAIKIELKEINLNFLLKNLSPRELEVYNLLLQGLNNQELIDKLHLSLPTVKQYKSEVMRKLKVNSLSKLIELAR